MTRDQAVNIGFELLYGGGHMTNNYYRCDGRFFFFDDNKIEETKRAYSLAQVVAAETGSRIVVYRVPRHEGYWDDAHLVGHRNRKWLEEIITHGPEANAAAFNQAKMELEALNAAFAERRA